MTMLKAMISQPMNGKSEEEIIATRENAIRNLEAAGYETVNTLFADEWSGKEKMEQRGVVQIPLCFLAKSLENMSLCHAVYFCGGWENARGCRLEHEVAKAYGLKIIYDVPKCEDTLESEGVQEYAKWIGHWRGDGILSEFWHSCSACGYKQDDEWNVLTPFCPGCGAKMDLNVIEE